VSALVYATPEATRAANRLLPGRCIENEVAKALGARRRPERPRRRVYLDDVVVSVARSLSPTSRRECWLVTAVERRNAEVLQGG